MNELHHESDEKRLYWFNYRTNKYEYVETPSDFSDYIPQQQAAIGMYRLLIKMGKNPIIAAQETLTACL